MKITAQFRPVCGFFKLRKDNNFRSKLLFHVYEGKAHREKGVKNGKKFHHQKAKRRTCSEAQGRRPPTAGESLRMLCWLLQPKGRMKKKIDLCPLKLPQAVNTSRAAASLLVSGSGTKFSDTIKKGNTHGRRGRVSGTKIHA